MSEIETKDVDGLKTGADIENVEEDPILAEWDGYSPLFGVRLYGEHYTLFKNRIKIAYGGWTQEITETPLSKIERTVVRTNPFGRAFGVGDVILNTKVMPKTDIVLHVKNPEDVLAVINQACYNERQAYLHSRGRGSNGYSHSKGQEDYKGAQRYKKSYDTSPRRNVAP